MYRQNRKVIELITFLWTQDIKKLRNNEKTFLSPPQKQAKRPDFHW